MQADVYSLENKKVGTVELPEPIFGVRWNAALVKQVVDAQLANRRKPWAHVRDRSEVRGGGRKPWRQKGTGRARHGSTRSPIWVGGGKAHGPRNDKDYSQKVNRKMKRAALFALLSRKAKTGEIKVIDTLALETGKTKALSLSLRGLLGMDKRAKRFDVLLVARADGKNLFRASSNLPKAKALDATSLNVYDILNHKHLFLDKASVAVIADHYQE